jgi:hypothetical protein
MFIPYRAGKAPVLVLFLILTVTSASAGAFEPTGPLQAPRSRAAGAVTSAGILVAGGTSTAGACVPVATAESYSDPNGAFSSLAAMVATRCHAAAVTLDDGRVLLVGGVGTGTGTAELFDPAAGTFTATGSPATPRAVGFTLTTLADGRVLLTGGLNLAGPLGSAEIYDPGAGTFAPAGAMTVPRAGHTATLLSDGRVLVAGGHSGTGCAAGALSAELFDPATGLFAATAGSPAFALAGHIAERLDDGRVLLAGGAPDCGDTGGTTNAQLFDPSTGLFAAASPMFFSHGRGLSSALLDDGRVLVTGGHAGAGIQSGADLFDPLTGTFSLAGLMGSPRAFHAGAPLAGARALVAGGDAGHGSVTASAEIFDESAILLAGTLRVTPRTLNRKSRGQFITAFVSVPGTPPSSIDPDSLAMFIGGLGPIHPLRVQPIGDANGDGAPDLQLKISRDEVIALAPEGEDIMFLVGGTLQDGTDFLAQDGVRVICPGARCGGSNGAFIERVREERRRRAAHRRGL